MLITAWLVFSVVGGIVWSARGREFVGGFLVSVLLSPVIGIIIGLALARR